MKQLKYKDFFFVLELVLLILIILALFLPLAPLPNSLPSRDSGVFLYAGWRVLNGDVPYLHIWDHKPPVIYFLDAIGLWLTPGSSWGVWLLEVILIWVSTIFAYRIFKKLYGLESALFTSFLWLFSAFYLLAGGNLTTEYALPSQFLLLWMFFLERNDVALRWVDFAIGVVSGVLFFTRQNAIAIPVSIILFLFIDGVYRRDFKCLLFKIGNIFAGFFAVLLLIVSYFVVHGALRQFWDVAFLYNFTYTGEKGLLDRLNALIQGINQLQNVGLAQLAFLGWGAAVLTLIFRKNSLEPQIRTFLPMAVLALPLELFFVSLGGRPRIPYFLVVLPIFSIFAGYAVWMILSNLKTLPKYAMVIFTFFMILSLGIIFLADYSELVADFSEPVGDYKIVEFIKNNTAPDDYVLMWGAEAAYNFAAMRASPTRYVYQTPLYNIRNKEAVFEFLYDILDKKPQMIVLRSDDKLVDRRFAYRDNETADLMEKIRLMYSSQTDLEGWSVYRFTQNK